MTRVKVEDLSYYPRPQPTPEIPEIENTPTLQRITETRQKLFFYFETGYSHLPKVTKYFDAIDREHLKLGSIGTVTGLTFLWAVARKKSRRPFKLVFYPAFTGGLTAAVCYRDTLSDVYKNWFGELPAVDVPMPESISRHVSDYCTNNLLACLCAR